MIAAVFAHVLPVTNVLGPLASICLGLRYLPSRRRADR
jgi:hypothetical protein